MSERKAFKDAIDRAAIRRIAKNIKRVHAPFPDRAFVRSACRGLEDLEMKARVALVIEALRKHLPEDVTAAIDVLVRCGAQWDRGDSGDTMSVFAAWPVIDFVGVHGLEHFELSMEALRRLTGLFTAEFAIRGFIERDPKRVMKVLMQWTSDSDPHVRRLVSEGTRPLLPWGRRLRSLEQQPKVALKALEKLKDDPAETVRRSVANHLNDISKNHPDLVVEVCRRWNRRASAERKSLIRHGLRTLIKQGHPGALGVLGFDPQARVKLGPLELASEKITLGNDLVFSFTLNSRARIDQPLIVDYAVHHVKKNGERTRKVFKLKTCVLKSKDSLSIEAKHKFRRITTRRYHSGRHAIEVMVNGKSHATAEFDLLVGDG